MGLDDDDDGDEDLGADLDSSGDSEPETEDLLLCQFEKVFVFGKCTMGIHMAKRYSLSSLYALTIISKLISASGCHYILNRLLNIYLLKFSSANWFRLREQRTNGRRH